MDARAVAACGLIAVAVVVAVLPLLGIAAPTADPGTGTALGGAPEYDGPGGGYGPTDELPIDASDGLNETEIDAVVGRSMARVAAIRDVRFDESVPVEVISRSEHRERTADQYESVSADDRLHQNVKFEALFMIPQDEDAMAEIRDYSSEGVVGYYSTDDDRIVLVSDDSESLRLDESVLAHELVHAWQDQQFNLSSYNRSTEDRNNALNGIVEGDANYVQQQYDRRCSARWDCLSPGPQTGGGSISHMGLFVLRYQPYSDGPGFVHTIRQRGGWQAVDAVYEKTPASTEQTIHPDRYPDDDPRWPEITDRSDETWTKLDVDSDVIYAEFGEAGLFSMFVYPSLESGRHEVVDPEPFYGGDDPRAAYNYSHPFTTGWDGDRLVPYVPTDAPHSNVTGYVWKTTWDAAADAEQFADGYTELLEHHGAVSVSRSPARGDDGVSEQVWRIDDGGYAGAYRIKRVGDRVVVTNAPSTDALDEIRDPPR